jgi:hypothetical protein
VDKVHDAGGHDDKTIHTHKHRLSDRDFGTRLADLALSPASLLLVSLAADMLAQGTSRLASVPFKIVAYAKASQAGWELYRLRFPSPRSPPLPSAQRADMTHEALDLPPASPATLPTTTVVCIDNDQM